MEEIRRLLKIKRNLIGLIVVLVLLVALPAVYYLAQTTQIFKPRAQAPAGNFVLGNGWYTNLCGSGTSANQNPSDICGYCDSDNGSCSTVDDYDDKYMYTFSCPGLHNECSNPGSGNEFGPNQTTFFNTNLAALNTTYQIDVFNKDCKVNGAWVCEDDNLISYMVWYSGTGVIPTTPPVISLNVTATLLTGAAACTGTKSNIRVDWDNVDGAASYKVYEVEVNTVENGTPVIVPQSPSEYIYSISNSGTYAFTVRAYSSTNASGTPLAQSAVSNPVPVPANYCGGNITPTPGGVVPTVPGGIVPTLPGGGGTPPCNSGRVCSGQCLVDGDRCGLSGRKGGCQFTTIFGGGSCTPVSTNDSEICDAGNTCPAPQTCENGDCVSGGVIQPTSPPAVTNAPTTTQTGVPTEYRIANVSSLTCPDQISSNPLTFTPNEGVNTRRIPDWPLLSGIGRKTICAQFKVDGIWRTPIRAQVDFTSASTPSPSPTTGAGATATPRPSATTTPGKSTASYRVAESIAELSSKEYLPYNTHPTLITHTFAGASTGTKQICVQFKATDGEESTPACAYIELVSTPEITSCSISPVSGTGDITLDILGKNFGTDRGARIVSSNTSVTFTSWTDTKVTARFTNPPVGQSFPISLTTGNGLTAQGACSSISQLAIGAQLFCPQVKDVTITGTEVTLIEASSSAKITEKATLKVLKANSVGVIEGLKTKLQEGKSYRLGIKVPRGVRRIFKGTSGVFTARGTTTNVEFTRDGNGAKLPLGDIFPVGTGDGSINSADFTQLKRDIAAAKATTNSYSDLNLDNWVNSFEWACMRPEIGTSDENLTDD